jgi:hypothetical protein
MVKATNAVDPLSLGRRLILDSAQDVDTAVYSRSHSILERISHI